MRAECETNVNLSLNIILEINFTNFHSGYPCGNQFVVK